MLILAVAEDLDKLLKNCCLTSVTFLRKLGGVVIMAVNLPVVFVVAVLSAEDGGTEGARKMVDVVLPLQCCNVRSSKGSAALVAEQAEASKVVRLAEGVLALPVFIFGRKELGCHDLSAVLWKLLCQLAPGLTNRCSTYPALEAVQMKRPVQGAHKLPGQGLTTLLACSSATRRSTISTS